MRKRYGILRRVRNSERKLTRALHHANELDRRIRRWSDKHQVRSFRSEHGPEADRIRFVFVGAPKPPPSWGVVIGDCLHDLRSGLDHLAFELAIAHSGTLTTAQEEGSEFPIFGPRPMAEREARAKIGAMHPDARAIVKRLQPHLRGDQYRRDPLWVLHDLSNIDKHRLLITAVSGHSTTGLGGGNVVIRSGFIGGSDIPDTVIADFRVGPADPRRPMDMKLSLGLGIRFAEGPAKGEDVLVTLRGLRQYIVGTVFPPLVKYL